MATTTKIIRQTLARGAVAIAVAAGVLLAGGSAPATGSGASDTPESIGQRFVPAHPDSAGGVLGAFGSLSKKADALALAPNGTPKPTTCKHIEGIARKDGPDRTPYLFYSKSGLVPGVCLGDNEPGYLIVARMGSREHNGERMRTNLLPFNTPSEWTNLGVDKAVTAIPSTATPAGCRSSATCSRSEPRTRSAARESARPSSSSTSRIPRSRGSLHGSTRSTRRPRTTTTTTTSVPIPSG